MAQKKGTPKHSAINQKIFIAGICSLAVFSSRVSSSHGHLSVVRRRRRPSSATRARFVMAGPIHLKLGGCVPWPKRVRYSFHFSILSLYVAVVTFMLVGL